MVAGYVAPVNGRLIIQFPFNLTLLEVVRQLPDRAWNLPSHKGVWSVPHTPFHCAQVIQALQKWGFEFHPDVKACADAKAERPDIPVPDGLYDYQKEAVRFIHAAGGRALIADAPGVGKSAPALVWATWYGVGKTLIVCPANVTWKWAEKECALWAADKTWQVVEGSKGLIQDVDVVIMSYRTMVLRYQELEKIPFYTIIFDEAHALKNNKSQQNRAARKLVRNVPHVILLTGTAYKNRRFELFQLLHILRPAEYRDAIQFGVRYCGGSFHQGHWIVPPHGETNTEELRERLSTLMLRRTKKQVAIHLPDLTRVSLPMYLSNDREYKETLARVRAEAKAQGYSQGRALKLLNTLRQVAGMGKVKTTLELAEELLEAGEQVVIHAHHRQVIKALVDGLLEFVPAAAVAVVWGDTSPRERQDISNEFLNGNKRVVVISSAGKEGLDLYSSSHIIFCEMQWTPGDHEQLEGRLHRNGQKNAVTAYYLLGKDTVDEWISDLLNRKEADFASLNETDVIHRLFVTKLLEERSLEYVS